MVEKQTLPLGRKLLLLLTIIAFAIMATLYIYGWLNALMSPLSIGYEGANLYIACELAKGKNIYDLSTMISPPWSVTIYPPVYFILVAPFQALFGWNFWSGRLVSIVSLLVTAWASFRVFRISGSSKLVSALALSTFLSYLLTWSWSFFGRVDMLSMAFSSLALERFLTIYKNLDQNDDASAGKNKQSVSLWMAYAWTFRLPILFSVLAVFAKQPSVVVPAVISIFLLVRNKRAEAFVFGGVSFLICLVILSASNLLTNGGFVPHMHYLSRAPVELDFLVEHIWWFGVDLLKVIIIPIIGLVWLFSRRSERQDFILLPILLTIFSGALALYTLGTEYAHINHAFHLIFALAWLTAELARPAPVASGYLMLGTTCAALVVIAFYGTSLFHFRSSMDDTIEKLSRLGVKGRVILTEDPSLALAAGARPLFVDLATFIQVWKRGKSSMDNVIEPVREKKYPVAIVNAHDADRTLPYLYWSKEFIDALKESYEKRDTIIGYRKRLYYLYLPKQGP